MFFRNTPKTGHGQDAFEPAGSLQNLDATENGGRGSAWGIGDNETQEALRDLQFSSEEHIPSLALLESPPYIRLQVYCGLTHFYSIS